MKKNKIYILMKCTVVDSINCVDSIVKIRPVGFVKTKKGAKAGLKKLQEEHKHTCEIAIKNVYAPYEQGCHAYSVLCARFIEYLQYKYFPQYQNYEFLDRFYPITEEERNKIEELFDGKDIYASDTFRNWCKNENGLSDDVIEATIKYNTIYGFNNISYYIEETEQFNIL